jgi:threonine dehydrogenase-like Zn-dependent dehydrogenase
VFLSQLKLLFKLCPSFKTANPLVETSQHGTKVVVHIYTHCGNPYCKQKESMWRSQPNMEGTKIAAGNFLLSFAILVAGASISKVHRVFTHIGMACILSVLSSNISG